MLSIDRRDSSASAKATGDHDKTALASRRWHLSHPAVLNYQHPLSGERLSLSPPIYDGWSGSDSHCELEHASAVWGTLHPDPSAHQLHETPADCKPQSSPTISSGDGGVNLAERLKQAVPLLRGYSDSGVPHAESQLDLLAVPPLNQHSSPSFRRTFR